MMVSKRISEKNDQGFVLIIVIFLMLLIAVVAAGMNRRAGMGARMSANQLGSMQAYLGQRAAIEHTKWQLKQTPTWRTSSSGEDYIFSGVTYTRKVLDKGDPCAGDGIEVSVDLSGGVRTIAALLPPPPVTESSGMAVWRQSTGEFPFYNPWNGSSFGTKNTSQYTGPWRIIAGAESPTAGELGEYVVVGVNSYKEIRGERWNGSQWTQLPFTPLNLGNVRKHTGGEWMLPMNS